MISDTKARSIRSPVPPPPVFTGYRASQPHGQSVNLAAFVVSDPEAVVRGDTAATHKRTFIHIISAIKSELVGS